MSKVKYLQIGTKKERKRCKKMVRQVYMFANCLTLIFCIFVAPGPVCIADRNNKRRSAWGKCSIFEVYNSRTPQMTTRRLHL